MDTGIVTEVDSSKQILVDALHEALQLLGANESSFLDEVVHNDIQLDAMIESAISNRAKTSSFGMDNMRISLPSTQAVNDLKSDNVEDKKQGSLEVKKDEKKKEKEGKDGKEGKEGKKGDKKEKKPKGPLRTIEIAYKISGLSEISAYTGTFCVDMKAFFWWKDEKLIGREKGTVIDVKAEKGLFDPDVVVTNEFTLEIVDSTSVVTNSNTGELKTTVTYSGTCFLQSMSLEMFPYDCQNVQICFKPYKLPIDEVLMVSKSPEECACATTAIQEWDLLGHFLKIFETDPLTSSTGKVYSTAFVTILIRRRSGWFIANVYLPTATFLLLSWLTFLYGDESFDERNDVVMNTLLASFSTKFIVSGQIPRVDYWTFLDYFMFFCFFSQILALFAAQAARNLHTLPTIGPYVNVICFSVQMIGAAVCFEWLSIRLYNHFVDIQSWVAAGEDENEKNRQTADAARSPAPPSGLKTLSGKEIPAARLTALSTSDDYLGMGSISPREKAAKTPVAEKRKSIFSFLTKHESVSGGFTSFGSDSAVSAMINQSKSEAKQKQLIKSHSDSGKIQAQKAIIQNILYRNAVASVMKSRDGSIDGDALREAASRMIQSRWRAKLAQRSFRKFKALKEENLLNLYATKIQRKFRLRQTRLQKSKLTSEKSVKKLT